MVCWAGKSKQFKTNSEVEDVLYVPLSNLLDPEKYACFRIYIKTTQPGSVKTFYKEVPCFLHQHDKENERLWGATFHMVVGFLKLVFNFIPPDVKTLPVVEGTLERNYLVR